ncbi:glycosyltransferase family 4 protein [Micromonospora sp. LOL_013]|uniref:glycosyltransferase family 4 protein n=1 Tax=Micromonospora sp. LOL_013 TaxID=3345414 RepID=UPI003A86D2E3
MNKGSFTLADRQLLVVSDRDVRHPDAGGQERYLHQVARCWAGWGASVSWAVERAPGLPDVEPIDGVMVVRSGIRSWRQPSVLTQLVRRAHAVVDATGYPRGSVLAGGRAPVVAVVTDPPPGPDDTRPSSLSALRRLSWYPATRAPRGADAIVTLSPAARHAVRRHARARGPIFVVPPGTDPGATSGARSADPLIVIDTRLASDRRIDVFLRALAAVAGQLTGLTVEVLGTGPELPRLRRMIADGALKRVVSLPGRLPQSERDRRLARAWLTVSTATAELAGFEPLRAAALGVPCLVLDTPGADNFVLGGRTGYVVADQEQLGAEIVRGVRLLSDQRYADLTARCCRVWAGLFGWDRTAQLLARVVEHQIVMADAGRYGPAQRRSARSDITTRVRLPAGVPAPTAGLRVTDEVVVCDGVVELLLNGCDEVDAVAVLRRLGVTGASVRLAGRHDLLIGPRPLPPALAGHQSDRGDMWRRLDLVPFYDEFDVYRRQPA